MRRYSAIAILIAITALASVAAAQEQQAGQPLYFPKEDVHKHPSDLHVGSDPQYKPGLDDVGGSDETGYPRQYDPQQEIVEEKTTYKRVGGGGEGEAPPSRWEQ